MVKKEEPNIFSGSDSKGNAEVPERDSKLSKTILFR